MKRLVAALLLVTAAACGKKAVPPLPRPAEPAPAPAVEAAEATGPEEAAGTSVPEVPPFARTEGADREQADALLGGAKSGLEMGMDAADALPDALAAVNADPGSGRARVFLAGLVDDEAFKIAQLELVVRATDCDDCVDAILNENFEEWPARVQELVADVKPGKQRAATDAIVGFIRSGEGSIAAYFKGKKVTLDVSCVSCDLSGMPSKRKPKTLTGKKALAWIVDGQKRGTSDDDTGALYALGEWVCAGDCCTAHQALEGEPNNHAFLTGVCFAPGTDQVTQIIGFD